MTIVRYDIASRSLEFDTSTAKPWGADITATLQRYGQTVGLAGVRYGMTVAVNQVEVASKEWPEEGETLVATDQDILKSHRVTWSPHDRISINAWIVGPLGRVDLGHTFTAPRPTQPYASWTWGDGQWNAPVPYPSSGGPYEWDEAGQEWVEV